VEEGTSWDGRRTSEGRLCDGTRSRRSLTVWSACGSFLTQRQPHDLVVKELRRVEGNEKQRGRTSIILLSGRGRAEVLLSLRLDF